MTLCYDARVLDAGHCVYFDNFFTSVALLEELFSQQTMACGTSRARVQGPQALQSKKPKIVLQPGEAVLFEEDLFLPSNASNQA